MGQAPDIPQIQYAALPFRHSDDGGVRVLLVSSRGGRRWVIPKGQPMPFLHGHEVAAREAYEEAGVTGTLFARRPVCTYRTAKRGKPKQPIDVTVFLLLVERQCADWPERGVRRHAWLPPQEAAALIEPSGLADVLRAMATRFPEMLDELAHASTAEPAVTPRRPRKITDALIALARGEPLWRGPA
jgi:8-oxo-dGTP pyrophosphatase MutT (NUDIX family)